MLYVWLVSRKRNNKLSTTRPLTDGFVFAKMVLMDKGITNDAGKIVLDEMFKTGEHPDAIIDRLGLWAITDPYEILAIARMVVWEFQSLSDQYIIGKKQVLNSLLGKAISKSKMRMDMSNMKLAIEIALREYTIVNDHCIYQTLLQVDRILEQPE